MSAVEIRIPQNQPELEAAIVEFVQAEFQVTATFEPEASDTKQHRDISFALNVLDVAWQIITVMAAIEEGIRTLEGAKNLAERIQRLERVKKLQAAIERAGKPVWMKIQGKTVDLYKKSADEIMNLLAGNKQ